MTKLYQRAAAETTCPRCDAEPMHPCETPKGRARSPHMARVEQREADEAVAATRERFEAIRDRDCPSCHAPAGEMCRFPGGRTCAARLADT